MLQPDMTGRPEAGRKEAAFGWATQPRSEELRTVLGPAPLYSQEGWPGPEAIVWIGQPDQASKVYQGAEVGQENHTKWSHIRVPELVDQDALQESWGPEPGRRL